MLLICGRITLTASANFSRIVNTYPDWSPTLRSVDHAILIFRSNPVSTAAMLCDTKAPTALLAARNNSEYGSNAPVICPENPDISSLPGFLSDATFDSNRLSSCASNPIVSLSAANITSTFSGSVFLSCSTIILFVTSQNLMQNLRHICQSFGNILLSCSSVITLNILTSHAYRLATFSNCEISSPS
ncbi:hypothetical protein AX774_g6889 [Zancudomyces culisetae]|uniref:Uncharacterized protein n=1 Tax=Zancudomyces culisetae TaxID=1213189 RepID=A0A1R1PFB7_ZANCU|nr:hypothetical protein AX774_g6889 [Zancudomyces culisetae]|eukprot:OMH79674.1 hypothetical protein AX774_g6889 [Zancudomyces culisetae]